MLRLYHAPRTRSVRVRWLLEEQLAGNDYLLGEEFSAADIMLGFTLSAARVLGVLDGHRALVAYLERLERRPAFQLATSN
jgi:glutathione S-transferase